MNHLKCKICNGELIQFQRYVNTPFQVQYLSKEYNTTQCVDLNLYQCLECGVVQIDAQKVSYFNTAIKSINWDVSQFRINQKKQFINKFNLQNKKIHYIDKQPVPQKYDAFFMFNYLQHFPQPRKVLRCIYNNLSQDGVGIIQVPNFDQILNKGIFGQFIIDHLFYFTKQSLRRTLQISGFDVLQIKQVLEDTSISVTVKKRRILRNDVLLKSQISLIKNIEDISLKYQSIAVWGAGHYALMLLTMLNQNCLNKIKFVLDDFEVKQNKLTPITHKMIYPSQYLLQNKVNAVIIIVGWQYYNVFKRIKQMNLNKDIKYYIIKKATMEELDERQNILIGK